jgi:predicted amidohydrolase
MEQLHIACGQFVATPGDKDTNLSAMERLTDEAASRGCRLILFPEMALTGYLPPEDMPSLAEPADGGAFARVADMARTNGIAVAYGFPELVPGRERRRNTFALIGPDGREIGRYWKVHLWDTEAAWCDPGTTVPIFHHEGTTISGWICYDTRFPELARSAFLAGAELCLVPTAWLGPPEEWYLSLRARALDNTLFVAGADLINPLPELQCRGLSLIVGPHGELMAEAEPGVECVIDAVLEPDRMARQRARVPLLRDRKPQLYRPLCEE